MSKKNIDWSMPPKINPEGQAMPVRDIPKGAIPSPAPPKDNDSTKKDK